MPDNETIETQEPAPPPAVADMTSENFNWDTFWGSPAPIDEPPAAPPAETYEDITDDVEDEADKQIAALRKQTEMNAKQLNELRTQQNVDQALEAWKKQATPAELALGDLLYTSQSLDELKKNEAIVKNAAKKADAYLDDALSAKEKEMQRKIQENFGLPIPPSFQPIPQADKANQALADGDLDQAASIMLEGMF